MPKKKPFKSRDPFLKGYKKRTYVVDPNEGIMEISEYFKGKNFPGKIKKPTLHAKGGLAGMRRFNRGGKVK